MIKLWAEMFSSSDFECLGENKEKYIKLRNFNFEPSFKLQWCRAQDLFGSQIPVTSGGFEMRISCTKGVT